MNETTHKQALVAGDRAGETAQGIDDTAGHLWTLNWIRRHYNDIENAAFGLRMVQDAAAIIRGGR